MSKAKNNKHIGYELLSLSAFTFGALLCVFGLMAAKGDGEGLNSVTRITLDLVQAMGLAPLLLAGLGCAALGGVMFMRPEPMNLTIPMVLGLSLYVASALVVGAVSATGGGSFGALLPGALGALGGGLLGAFLGLTLMAATVWLALGMPSLQGVNIRPSLGKSEKDGEFGSIRAALKEDANDGVTQAEAAALIPEALPAPAAAPGVREFEMRMRGELPAGVTPLHSNSDDSYGRTETESDVPVEKGTLGASAIARPLGSASADLAAPKKPGTQDSLPDGVWVREEQAAAQDASEDELVAVPVVPSWESATFEDDDFADVEVDVAVEAFDQEDEDEFEDEEEFEDDEELEDEDDEDDEDSEEDDSEEEEDDDLDEAAELEDEDELEEDEEAEDDEELEDDEDDEDDEDSEEDEDVDEAAELEDDDELEDEDDEELEDEDDFEDDEDAEDDEDSEEDEDVDTAAELEDEDELEDEEESEDDEELEGDFEDDEDAEDDEDSEEDEDVDEAAELEDDDELEDEEESEDDEELKDELEPVVVQPVAHNEEPVEDVLAEVFEGEVVAEDPEEVAEALEATEVAEADAPPLRALAQPGLFDATEDVPDTLNQVELAPAKPAKAKAAPKPKAEPKAKAAPKAKPDPSAPAASLQGDEAYQDLVYRAGVLFLNEGRVAVSMLQRRFELDFKGATQILDDLQNLGLIGPYIDGKQRAFLLSAAEWDALKLTK
jgi:hypothetical protein